MYCARAVSIAARSHGQAAVVVSGLIGPGFVATHVSPHTTFMHYRRAPTKPPRRLAASRNARNKAKDGQKEKRCGAGYQRKNGRWEGRFRPTSRFELPLDDEDIRQAFRGVKIVAGARVYRYEWVSYFNSSEDKDNWLQYKKQRFKAAVAEAKRAEEKPGPTSNPNPQPKAKSKGNISVNETASAASFYAQMCVVKSAEGAGGASQPVQTVYTDSQFVYYCGGCNHSEAEEGDEGEAEEAEEADQASNDPMDHGYEHGQGYGHEDEYGPVHEQRHGQGHGHGFGHEDQHGHEHPHDLDHDIALELELELRGLQELHGHDDEDGMMTADPDDDPYMLASAAEAAAAACELQVLLATRV